MYVIRLGCGDGGTTINIMQFIEFKKKKLKKNIVSWPYLFTRILISPQWGLPDSKEKKIHSQKQNRHKKHVTTICFYLIWFSLQLGKV